MESREERRARLRKASKEAVARADALVAEELAALKQATTADLEALRPKVKDAAAYEELLAAVAEATRRNESMAEFRERLQRLGQSVAAVAKDVAKLLK